MTTTVFKQKKCPKCRNNHDNEGVLCSFCAEKEEIKRTKMIRQPESFWVKCLIDREGDTVLTIGNIRYMFRRNEFGDSVCEIINQGHYNQIIKSSFYEPYVTPAEATDIDNGEVKKAALFTDEEAALIDRLRSAGKNVKEIAATISDFYGRPVSWQRIMRYQSTKRG